MGGRRHLILYDGVCGLCNRLNRFVIARDERDVFRFASLQGPHGRAWLTRFGEDAEDLTTFHVVVDFESEHPRLLSRSSGALFVLDQLGGIWRGAKVFRALPTRLRDWAYGVVARHRYEWFGRYDACPLPAPSVRARFLEEA